MEDGQAPEQTDQSTRSAFLRSPNDSTDGFRSVFGLTKKKSSEERAIGKLLKGSLKISASTIGLNAPVSPEPSESGETTWYVRIPNANIDTVRAHEDAQEILSSAVSATSNVNKDTSLVHSDDEGKCLSTNLANAEIKDANEPVHSDVEGKSTPTYSATSKDGKDTSLVHSDDEGKSLSTNLTSAEIKDINEPVHGDADGKSAPTYLATSKGNKDMSPVHSDDERKILSAISDKSKVCDVGTPVSNGEEKGSSTVSATTKGIQNSNHSAVAPSGTSAPQSVERLPPNKYEYDFTHKHRGVAHVFVNIAFDKVTKQPYRKGAEKDTVHFKAAFKHLGFKVKVFEDYTVTEIMNEIQEYCRADHADDDCVVFAFSTHGDQRLLNKSHPLASDVIYGKDALVAVSKLTEMVTEEKCPDMAKKPKLFFFQACRGDQLAETLQVTEKSITLRSLGKQLYCDIRPVEIPLHKDYFLAFSAPPGFYSFRNKSEGSWFISVLCSTIKEHGLNSDLLELITAVNHRMAIGGDKPQYLSNIPINIKFDQRMTIPWTASMLTKLVHFRPKK